MAYKKLSIIIPVYNTEPYLRKCLQSVVNAAKGLEEEIEVLIINDGSPDNSYKIIDEFCLKYKWMKSFLKQNGGLSDVKNYGLLRATGEYVIFLDSDDFIEPEMYKKMFNALSEEHADVVICDIRLVYDDPLKNTVYPCTISSRTGVFSQIIDMSMMPASWNKMVRRDLYNGLSFPVGQNNEDIAVTPLVLAHAKKIAVINEALYNYYQRSGSIQNGVFSERRFVILKTSKLCIDRLNSDLTISDEKKVQIKGSIYLHQVLSMAFYPIRYEAIRNRYRLLKLYMTQVEELFPDLWDCFEIKEFQTWENFYMQIYRKTSCFLLKNRYYLLTSIFWSFCKLCKKLLLH